MPEPEGLVAVGRIAKPDAILQTAGGWAGLPLPGGSELVRSVTDDAVADSVDLSQPVEGAVVLAGSRGSPKPLYAFAVAVRSFEDAKNKLSARHRVGPAPNGAIEIKDIGKEAALGGESGRGAEDDDEDEESTCVLAHASSGARLVCGEPAALESLTPYLTRTLPRASFASDVHVEVRFGPIRGPVSDLRAQLPILARTLLGSQSQAVRDMVDAAVGELADIVADTERIVLDGQIADVGVNANVRVEYGSAKSLVAQLATAGVDRAGPPPPAFWHVPQETDVAFFGKGTDPKLFQRPRELLANLMLEAFAEGGMPETERKTIKDLVANRMMPLLSGPAVYAKGYDAKAVDDAIAKRRGIKQGDIAARDDANRILGEQIVGWHLLQVSEPIANVGRVLKDWSALWARPAFSAWAKKQSSSKTMARVRVAPLPSAVVLPKDSVHLEVTIPREDLEDWGSADRAGAKPGKKKKISRKPIVAHVFAIPDAGSTWLAFGLDQNLVAKKAAVALSSAPQTGTLGSVAGYEALHDASKINGAAALTMRGLLVLTAVDRDDSPYARLSTLPAKGATPALLTFAAEGPSQDGKAKAGAATASVRVPRAMIQDMVRLLMTSR